MGQKPKKSWLVEAGSVGTGSLWALFPQHLTHSQCV